LFLIGIAHNRLIDEQHDLDASGPNPPHGSHYTYDPVGNRLQMNWGIDSSIVYDYDVHQSSPQSWRNRLLGYTQYVGPEVPGQETLEVTYQYSDALIRGNPTRITWHYLHLDPDPEYRSIRPYYDTLKHLWLAYEETWNTDESGNCVDHTRVRATEFRYDSGRARYLVRARDPSTLQPTTQAVWTDYDGDAPYEDYTFAASTSTLTSLTGYLPGLGQRDSASGAKAYHHGDQIDSMRLMTDGAGNVVRRQTYTAFGIPIIEDGPQQTRYGYAGAWGYESVTPPEANDPLPWIHVGERWYDPMTGRFLQRDPIGIGGGNNLFAYILEDPANRVDPEGLNPRWREQVRQRDGTFGRKKLLYRRISPNRWLWAYGLGSGFARAGHWLCGAPYEEPLEVLLDIAELQYEADKRNAENARQRQLHPEVFPPAPPRPPRADVGILCLQEGTLLETSFGLVPVECIAEGCMVRIPSNASTAQYAPVTKCFASQTTEIVDVIIDQEILSVTFEHPFWVAGRGWIAASELQTGDLLLTIDQQLVPVVSVSIRELVKPINVYNVSVHRFQMYYIGKCRVLTHNRSC
jgi:RHS repeat-associated protein